MSTTIYDCSANPYGMAYDNCGNLYVAVTPSLSPTYTSGIIQVINSSGISTIELDQTPWFDNPSPSSYGGTITIAPTGITIDNSNNLYIATPFGNYGYNPGIINKYSLDNSANSIYNYIWFDNTPTAFTQPYQLTYYDDYLFMTGISNGSSNASNFFIGYVNLPSLTEVSGNNLQTAWNIPINIDYSPFITNDNNGFLYITNQSTVLDGSFNIIKLNISASLNTTPSYVTYNISSNPIYGITYLSGYLYYNTVYTNSSGNLESDFYYTSVSNIGEGYQVMWQSNIPSNFNSGWSSNGYNELYVAQQTNSSDTSLLPLINVISIPPTPTPTPTPSNIVYPPTDVILRKNGILTFKKSITENVLYYYQLNKKNIYDKSLNNLVGPITSPYNLNLQSGFIYVVYLYAYSPATNIYSSPAISNFVSIKESNPIIPVGNICFKKGTKIKTDQGEIEIDKINIKKHTIYHQPILAITKNILTDNFMVRIKKNAFGKNIPSDDIVLSKEHKIYVNGKLFSPGNLVNYKNIFKENYDNEIVYNILMKNHHLIFVNSLLCETLHPKNKLAKLYLKKNSLLIENLNQWIEENNFSHY